MLSNLASYIFGANTETVAEGQQIHEVKADKATASSRKGQQDEDWEIVGGDVQPPLNLGSLDEVAPRPSTGSTGSSETPSEVSKPFFFLIFFKTLYLFIAVFFKGWSGRCRRHGRSGQCTDWSTRNRLNEVCSPTDEPSFLSQWGIIAPNESFKKLTKGQAKECC